MDQINIRGRNYNLPQKKMASDNLHECFDCEGCMMEAVCRKYEEENFKKKIRPQKEGDL